MTLFTCDSDLFDCVLIIGGNGDKALAGVIHGLGVLGGLIENLWLRLKLFSSGNLILFNLPK